MPRAVVEKPLVPSHARLTDADEVSYYWSKLLTLWGVASHARVARSSTFFPGCNPCSVSRQNANVLREHNDYRIALKSDGVRYALFLTLRRDTDDGAIALMVDRSRNMYEVEVVAPEDYFVKGSVLEGEIVWHPESMVYHVFDAICLKGETLTRLPFAERLARATRVVQNSEEASNAPDVEERALETDAIVLTHFEPRVRMRAKTFVSVAHAAALWRDRADAGHRVDGLILHDATAPYKMGTASDGSCLKWKEHSTIDLSGPPDALWAADGPLPPTLHERNVVVTPSRIVGTKGSLIEYHITVTPSTVELMAMRTRPDKVSANGLYVVRATVGDVIHTLRPDDIASESGHN